MKGMSRFFYVVSFTALTLALGSCSNYYKVQRSDDIEEKYVAAMEYYENEDYFKATTLFDDILPLIRGTEKAEIVQFLRAYAYYHQKQYLLSSHYFKTFFEVYNRSRFAEESFYMHAYSLYLDSPRSSLDQTSTNEAIGAMQVFLNRFPSSEYSSEASEVINLLQQKLERKAFDNAIKLYSLRQGIDKGGYIKAALVAFENFERDYPDSDMNEQIRYLRIEAQYELAKVSIDKLQRERYRTVINAYEQFIDNYPESSYLKQAERWYAGALDSLEKLNKAN